MKHLVVCPEYPPAHGGGIGTYVRNMARLFAEAGETVHVVSQQWRDAEADHETRLGGRLVVHRLPYLDWRSRLPRQPHPHLPEEARRLFGSGYHPLAFAWQVARLVERLTESESIDVVEGQEYEAPLYLYQMRRALGLAEGPGAPTIVHLHSPTELILRNNDWPVGHPALVAERYESQSIRTADALLSPSRYLAAQVAERQGLDPDTIEIIGYPVGPIAPIDRDAETLTAGRVCYLGRLEGRKGVLEWIDAAVAVASERPGCSFDFVGENVLGDGTLPGQEIVARRIPPELSSRFRFHGRRPHSEMPAFLAAASLCVVPSRWDNFPNTCIEAMSSGLPVLATREGGMAELVEDGRSGWLADAADEVELARTLRKALATDPATLAEMGREAARRVRSQCDNDEVVERQLEFRHRLVERGARRPLRLPGPRSGLPSAGREATAHSGGRGLAIVVSPARAGQRGRCSESLVQQTTPPAAVVLLGGQPSASDTSWPDETSVLSVEHQGDTASRANAALRALEAEGIEPIGVAFVEAGDRLERDFIAVCARVLERQPGTGVISFWSHQRAVREAGPGPEAPDRVRPCPDLPSQWLRNDVAPPSVYRWEALSGAVPLRPALRGSFALWDLANAVLIAGWSGVTVPRFLAEHRSPEMTESAYPSSQRMRALLLERLPSSERLTLEPILQGSALDPRLRLADESMSQRERFDLLVMLLARSGALIRWFGRVMAERLFR